MPRYSIDVTSDERDQLKAMAKKEERSMMSIMRVVFRRGLRVCISTSDQRQSNVKVTSDQRHSDACPDPAPAPEQSTKVVVDKETTTDPVGEIAALFTSLDWRDAVLPQRLTPAMYAAQLLEMFPDKNLPQQIRRAQIWHLERKPSWKRLAHALNGWLAKPTPEWEKNGQGSMFGNQKQSDQQNYDEGVDENGNW